MNLSFVPANLHLKQTKEKEFIVSLDGQEILRTKSSRTALVKFNALREELEKTFPMREPTPEEKSDLLQREIKNSLLGHNSLGGRKKKTSAGGTRTFGG